MKLEPRIKKLIGLILFLPALLLYIGIVVTFADLLPDHWAVYLTYYVFMGSIWAFPLKPLMIWMNRPADPDQT